MKAIVLTHDKNIHIADHMIFKYHQLWPEHPFQFYIPYQSEEVLKRPHALSHNKKHIRTPKSITDTVHKLTEDIDPNEWVYWCPDDKFPIKLITKEIQKIIDFLPETDTHQINKISFSDIRMYNRSPIKLSKLLKEADDFTEERVGNDYINLRPKDFLFGIWLHHFIRAGLLRWCFKAFPIPSYEHIRRAVLLIQDSTVYYQDLLLDFRYSRTSYVYKKSLGLYAESIVAGYMTPPCYKSMKQNKLLHHKEKIRITKEEKGTYFTWMSPEFLKWSEKIYYVLLPGIYYIVTSYRTDLQKNVAHKIKRILYLTLKRPFDSLSKKIIQNTKE